MRVLNLADDAESLRALDVEVRRTQLGTHIQLWMPCYVFADYEVQPEGLT